MKQILLYLSLLVSAIAFCQADTMKWARAYPITAYITSISDTTKIVQVNTNGGITDGQLGLLRGVYHDVPGDTAIVGMGKCRLIKGTYYYFTINLSNKTVLPKEGDLLYILVPPPPVHRDRIVKLAAHYIGLQNVYGDNLFEREKVFSQWTEGMEDAVIDSMMNDVRLTGNYFLANDTSMNVAITSGKYKGQRVLQNMQGCTRLDVTDFLGYMVARPRLYAGRQWKIAELYATWLAAGAPIAISN